MARPGDYRYDEESGQWEVYQPSPDFGPKGWVPARQPPMIESRRYSEQRSAWDTFVEVVDTDKSIVYRWRPLEIINPSLSKALARFDGERASSTGELAYHVKDAPTDEWFTINQMILQASGLPLVPPEGYDNDYPVLTSSGEINVSATQKALREAAKPPTPSGAFPTSAAARQAAASDPDLAGYQPVRDSGTGQWYLEAPKGKPSAVQQEAARLEQEAALVRAQQPPPQEKPSFDDTILEALLSGNEDKALYFDAFQNRPSRLQALAFAMQYAETPEEFDQLFALAQGPALDYAETQPVFTQARAQILGSLPPSLGGQAAPPTTQELRVQGAQQDYVAQQQAQGIFRPQGFFNTPPGPPQERFDEQGNLLPNEANEGVRGPTQPLPTLTNEGQQIAYTEAYEQYVASYPERYAEFVATHGRQPTEEEVHRAPNAAEIQGLKEAATFPEATAGPDLSDVPSAEETRAATGGKTIAAPGVAVIPDFVKKAGLTFYDPSKEMQLLDYANELDEILAGVPGKPAFTAPEGFDPDEAKAAKAAELGVENVFRKKQPQPTFSAPASIFKRKQPQPEPQPTFRTPRYIGAR